MNPLRGRLFWAAKWLWLLAAGYIVAVLAIGYWDEISEQVNALRWWQLLASAGSLAMGKILLALGAQRAMYASQGRRTGFLSLLAMVSLSQLGKYVPGGIWHFVGRSALYAAHGLRPIIIAKVLVLENVWQWVSALLIGTLLLLYSYYGDLNLPLQRRWGVLLLALVLFFVWRVLFQWSRRQFASAASKDASGRWLILTIQAGAWICFGISLWVLLPVPLAIDGLVLAIGAFALATLAGFLVPLAPAGLGIREFVLVAMLSKLLDAEQASICAGLSRLVWLAVETGLAIVLHRWAHPTPSSAPKDANA